MSEDDLITAWQRHLEDQRDKLTEIMAKVFEEHKGGTVDQFMEAIREAVTEVSMTADDGWLRPYAETMAAGHPIVFALG